MLLGSPVPAVLVDGEVLVFGILCIDNELDDLDHFVCTQLLGLVCERAQSRLWNGASSLEFRVPNVDALCLFATQMMLYFSSVTTCQANPKRTSSKAASTHLALRWPDMRKVRKECQLQKERVCSQWRWPLGHRALCLLFAVWCLLFLFDCL